MTDRSIFVERAAVWLTSVADSLHVEVRATIDGTEISAWPGERSETVFDRWQRTHDATVQGLLTAPLPASQALQDAPPLSATERLAEAVLEGRVRVNGAIVHIEPRGETEREMEP